MFCFNTSWVGIPTLTDQPHQLIHTQNIQQRKFPNMFVCLCVYLCICVCIADMSGVDWMVRHGRSLALAIAVKAAPDRLCGRDYGDTVTESIMANATADRVSR